PAIPAATANAAPTETAARRARSDLLVIVVRSRMRTGVPSFQGVGGCLRDPARGVSGGGALGERAHGRHNSSAFQGQSLKGPHVVGVTGCSVKTPQNTTAHRDGAHADAQPSRTVVAHFAPMIRRRGQIWRSRSLRPDVTWPRWRSTTELPRSGMARGNRA